MAFVVPCHYVGSSSKIIETDQQNPTDSPEGVKYSTSMSWNPDHVDGSVKSIWKNQKNPRIAVCPKGMR